MQNDEQWKGVVVGLAVGGLIALAGTIARQTSNAGEPWAVLSALGVAALAVWFLWFALLRN